MRQARRIPASTGGASAPRRHSPESGTRIRGRLGVAELLPLAIASAFWPLLLVVVLVALRAAHPVRVLVSFLAGGLVTTVAVGLVIVYALDGTALTHSSRSTVNPYLEAVVGALAVLAALVLWCRVPQLEADTQAAPPPAGPSRIERALDHGAPLAFATGIVLNLVPGFFPLIALKNIADLNAGFAQTASLLLGFYIVMFALVEIPLAAYLVRPEATDRTTRQFNSWLGRNARRLAIAALGTVGAYLLLHGLIDIAG